MTDEDEDKAAEAFATLAPQQRGLFLFVAVNAITARSRPTHREASWLTVGPPWLAASGRHLR